MARLIYVAVALFALVASAQALVPPPYSPPPYSGGGGGSGGELPPVEADMALFTDFMTTFGRTYSGAEKDARFECFRKNLRLIEERNAKGQNVERHGINRFADVCAEEFKAKHLTHRSKTVNVGVAGQKPTGAPSCQKIDWRTKGAVTPVANEGMCGSCWAFSTVQNIEGVIAASGKPLIPLSVQELIDCSGPAGNDGCNGGELAQTYEWVIENGGLDSAADYPYRASQGVCNKKKEKKHVGVISGYMNITQNEADIASAVCKYGPINVAVDATSWQMYTGGVLQTCPYQSLDFSATIVGFDLTATPPYWILKSTWSSSWGENGYINIEYGQNLCGINQEAVTATL